MKRILSIVLTLALLLTALPLALGVSAAPVAVATFELGNDGSASHNDGSGASTYTETIGDYTLSLTGGTNMYTGARDAKGNGCLKFGASSSSKTGYFTFTVPDDITSVVLYVAKYKTNNTSVTVNGTTHALTKNSANGEYDEIAVDTTSTKTITFATVSGKQRAMMNTIVFYKEVAGACEHTSTHVEKDDANYHKYVCDDCGNTAKAEGHEFELIGTDPASCTETGTETYECSICGETKVEVLGLEPHKYENGKCTVCGNSDIIFEFGENGAASHSDGSELKEDTSYEVANFTLTLTGLTKVYGNARDAKGNSCLKLGTGSAIGSFAFTVTDNVETVIIKAARYKSYTAATVVANGTNYELTKTSDNGEYDEIRVDTKTTKTVVFATTTDDDKRAMVNSISFIVGETPACTHENTTTTNTATYFKAGKVTVYCEDCKTTVSETDADPITTNPVIFKSAVLDPATNVLTVEWEYSAALSKDIENADSKALEVKFAFGEKEYSAKLDTVDNLDGKIEIKGINADRYSKNLTVKLLFTIGEYETDELNSKATFTKAVSETVDSNNAKADEYTTLINALADAETVEIAGAGTDNNDFTAGASKIDIKAGTAEIKFVAKQALIDTLKGKEQYNTGRKVTLVVTIGNESHEVTLAKLMSSITVKISGLSFDQMYGSISTKLVIDYEAIEDIETETVTFNFKEAVNKSTDAVAEALEALLNK